MKNYRLFIQFIVFFTAAFSLLNRKLDVPYLSASLIGIIGYLVFLLWDRWLWKEKRAFVPVFGFLMGFHNYPDISGKWTADYSSSYNYDDENAEYRTFGTGEVEIQQTYRSIFIKGRFGELSKFDSFAAMLKQKQNGSWFLVYIYCNNPINQKLKDSQSGGMHEGFCYLDISNDQLEGYYTNDENRKTRGKISLTRQR